MFAVPEVAPNGASASQSSTQQQIIASVVAQQRVIAGQAGAESGDASARNFAGSNDRGKAIRDAERMKQRTSAEPDGRMTAAADRSAVARSIVEAQEASMTDSKIVAAFQARHGMNDLLSVIRDPEDRMLPTAPKD